MSIKTIANSLVAAALIAVSGGVQAGKEGVSLFYGAGVGAISPTDVGGVSVYDAAGGAGIFIGMEEDGWALEYGMQKTVDAGTINSAVDYNLTITGWNLGYRTLEDNGGYYLLSYGQTEVDVDLVGTSGSATGLEGDTYSLGMGWRTGKETRMEVVYTFIKSDDFVDSHMISLRYLFGGPPKIN